VSGTNERFAVDVGGTFTDIVVLDPQTGETRYAKTPTTPRAPSEGVLTGVDKAGVALESAQAFVHGTTLGLNTVLQGGGAKTGILTTQGFRDALEIARLNWPMYQLHWNQPPPLVPRALRREVPERMGPDGTVIEPLDEDAVRREVEVLIDRGVESIAVVFLHAYAYPEHERRVGEILAAEYPDTNFTLSHLVVRDYREYERTVTTVIDATIAPRMTRYFDHLEGGLRTEGFGGPLRITRSDGGVMGLAEAKERTVRTLISGPASGVMGVVALGRALGLKNLVGIDMGGTSFDAALVVDGEPALESVSSIEGFPLLMPMVEIATIGSGGGSIAWLDAGGALNVGPQSAGAEPGPLCYSRGGDEPTFTDAALVTGLIDPGNFLGGEIELDAEAAEEGVRTRIAEPLGLGVVEAAAGIVALAETKMAATVEEITVGKGYDPRDFTLVAYGGGGPLLACAIAERLGIPTTIVPRSPATFSAWGMLTLDVVHDFAYTQVSPLADLVAGQLHERFEALEREAHEVLEREQVQPRDRQMFRSLDIRYDGQEHTLSIPLANGLADSASHDELRSTFDERHQSVYGYALKEPVEIVAYRVRAVGQLEKPRGREWTEGGEAEGALKTSRTVVHRESGGSESWDIYERERLGTDAVVRGPAIVEEPTATTLVLPGQTASIDGFGNLVVTNGAKGSR
jgi:N-methylhydantoinase A